MNKLVIKGIAENVSLIFALLYLVLNALLQT